MKNIPPLPSGFQWSSPASTTLGDTFSVDSNRYMTTLAGEMWTVTSTAGKGFLQDDGFLQKVLTSYQGYYNDLISQHGWQVQIDLDGHKLVGIEADGNNYGSDYGLIKTQNDHIRAVVLQMGRSWGITSFKIFLSDIIPITQIIPDYKSNCIK